MPMLSDDQLRTHVLAVRDQLLVRRWQLVTAESCTGGYIGKLITDLAGSSAWYRGGAIVYSNALKEAILGVSAQTLNAHGAVSRETALEMARGALERLGGDIALSVTGIAGPDGGTPQKPVGTVWFGWAWRNDRGIQASAALETFSGDRDAVRRHSVARALSEIEKL
jgi:nicotinamide-nucleotide amidase